MPRIITAQLSDPLDRIAGRNGRPRLSSPPGEGPAWLRQVAEQLNGGVGPEPVTVRKLINSFGYSRRSSEGVALIEKNLASLGMKTDPDFRYVWLDTEISFVLLPQPASPAVETGEEPEETASNVFDPTQRLSQLEVLRNQRLVSVRPEHTIAYALTLMMPIDYSQLPVMSGKRVGDVKGVVTFAAIAKRLALGPTCTSVRDCMEPPQILDGNTPLFKAIDDIVRHQFVLVKDETNTIKGIVTTSDVSEELKRLTEPFLLLVEIEQQIRALIERAGFSTDELRGSVEDDQERSRISQVSDLTFGGYVRLLQEPERWRRLNLNLDRVLFNTKLNEVREIRNAVMHAASPDPLEGQDLQCLREFLALLRGVSEALGDVRRQDSQSVTDEQKRERI
jgi:CBS domain-containing protein